MRTSPAFAPATVPRTWPSSAISPSTWYDKAATSDQSRDGENEPLGIRNTCSKSSAPFDVNLDSLPCNNILPGIFDSGAQHRHVRALLETSSKSFDELWRERAAGNPAGRFGRPAELGAYCAFLCSQQAGYVTGQNLLIDGGSYPGTY